MGQSLRRNRGFNLAQLLFALFLAGVFMAVTARLFTGYSAASVHLRIKDQQLQLTQHILKQICGELSESYLTTFRSGPSAELRIDKRDPSGPIPPPPHPTAPIPLTYEPNSSRHNLSVRYRLNSAELSRQALKSPFVPGGGPGTIQRLADDIDGFTVTETGRRFEVSLTVLQNTRVVVLRSHAFRWRDAP